MHKTYVLLNGEDLYDSQSGQLIAKFYDFNIAYKAMRLLNEVWEGEEKGNGSKSNIK